MESISLNTFQVQVWQSELPLKTREFLIRLSHVADISNKMQMSELLGSVYYRLNYQMMNGSPDITYTQIMAAKKNLPHLDFQITTDGILIYRDGSSVPVLNGSIAEYITRAYAAKAARV